MTNAQPQRASKRRRRRGDSHLVARVKPDQPIDMGLLAEALMLHSQQQRALADGSSVPHLAGLQKLSSRRGTTSEEGEDA